MVQYLLAHNYLLTALELLVEAQEAGNEDDVESLQHFFSDQAKFPAEVVAKFDPNDGTSGQFAQHGRPHVPALCKLQP